MLREFGRVGQAQQIALQHPHLVCQLAVQAQHLAHRACEGQGRAAQLLLLSVAGPQDTAGLDLL